MTITFVDNALLELYEAHSTKDKKYKKLCRDKRLVDGYVKTVNIMFGAPNTKCLRNYSSLHYEKLRYRNESSVRIANGRIERLIFTEKEEGIEIEPIEIDQTHYGSR